MREAAAGEADVTAPKPSDNILIQLPSDAQKTSEGKAARKTRTWKREGGKGMGTWTVKTEYGKGWGKGRGTGKVKRVWEKGRGTG